MGVGTTLVGTGFAVGDKAGVVSVIGLGVDVDVDSVAGVGSVIGLVGDVDVDSPVGVTVDSGLSEQTASTRPAPNTTERRRAARKGLVAVTPRGCRRHAPLDPPGW